MPDTLSQRRPRSRRRTKRSADPQVQIFKERQIPAYGLLDESSLIELEQQADWLLENIGMEFHGDDTALELFKSAGASVSGVRAKFEPGLVRELCSTAPSTFKLHSRNHAHTVELGSNNIVLMPGYGSPFVTDLENGRRYATLEDFHNFVKLTYTTPHLHHSGGTVVEPVDVAVSYTHLTLPTIYSV